jgi:hypothetical protein
LFQDRFLFVKRHLKPSGSHRLLFITRGLPHLRKLREIMDHIYALFDRRCRTQTALGKLKKLRHWVKRFKWIEDTLKKVFSPNLEKALTFLDDKLLPATSNAVERGNRRHRKMQKSVYRVRSKDPPSALRQRLFSGERHAMRPPASWADPQRRGAEKRFVLPIPSNRILHLYLSIRITPPAWTGLRSRSGPMPGLVMPRCWLTQIA